MNTINQIVARAARLAVLALIVAAAAAQAQTLDGAGAEPDAADIRDKALADSQFLSGINRRNHQRIRESLADFR